MSKRVNKTKMKIEENPVYRKYQGKTVRIDRKIYRIDIKEYSDNDVIVWLYPKYGNEQEACSMHGRIYDDSISQTTYAHAVDKSLEVLDELEEADIAEIEA